MDAVALAARQLADLLLLVAAAEVEGPDIGAGAADRWQASIGRRQAAWLRRLLGRRIAEMGYEPALTRTKP